LLSYINAPEKFNFRANYTIIALKKKPAVGKKSGKHNEKLFRTFVANNQLLHCTIVQSALEL
jgi:hypothetical protein